MDFAEQLKQLKEQRKALYESIKKAANNEELDKIELDIRKLDHQIEELKIKISEEDPAKRSMENDDYKFDPMEIYIRSDKYNNGNAQKISNDIFLRKGDLLSEKIKAPEEERNLDIGKYIRGITTGNWEGAEKEKRAMMTTGTGVLIPQTLSSQLIDIARNKSLFTLANVPVLPMTENNVTIARLSKDPVFKFKEEGQQAEESGIELESVTLKSKTCYGYAYVSLEAIQSSKNLTNIINQAFSSSIAEAIDQGMLYGQYNGSSYDKFAPNGVMNDESINSIEAVANDGYDTFIKAVGKIKKNNGIPTVYGINADTEEKLSLLKDSQGRYLEKPESLKNIVEIVSNQLKNSDSDGDEALVFDPTSMIVGIQNNVNIQMFNNTDECIKKGLVAFRIYTMLDCVVTRPKHICKITGIK